MGRLLTLLLLLGAHGGVAAQVAIPSPCVLGDHFAAGTGGALGNWANDLRLPGECDPADRRETGDDLPIGVRHHSWSGTAWDYTARTALTYDEAGCLIESVQEDSSSTTGWQNSSRGISTCDAAGNTVEGVYQRWFGYWQNESRNSWTYDLAGRVTVQVSDSWLDGDWVPGGRVLWEYDADGNLARLIYQERADSTWVNTFRLVYSYDGEGRRTESVTQSWSGTEWVNELRQVRSYTTGPDMNGWLSYTWDSGTWTISSRGTVTHTYDAGLHRQLSVVDMWVVGGWELHSESFLSHYTDGRFDEQWARIWDAGWQNQGRFANTYDASGRQESHLVQKGHGTTWVNDALSTRVYDSGTATDRPPDGTGATISASPNPTGGRTSVAVSLAAPGVVRVALFDATGRRVSTLHDGPLGRGRTELALDTGGLSPGVYVIGAYGGAWSTAVRLAIR